LVLLHCWHMPLFFYYNSCAYNCSTFTMWGSKKENLNLFCFGALLTPTITPLLQFLCLQSCFYTYHHLACTMWGSTIQNNSSFP
jgi:hypothetical protein